MQRRERRRAVQVFNTSSSKTEKEQKGTKSILLYRSYLWRCIFMCITTIRHHFWYKSGFVLLQNYFEKEKKREKKPTRRYLIILRKYLLFESELEPAPTSSPPPSPHRRQPQAKAPRVRPVVQVGSYRTCSKHSRCRITSPSRSKLKCSLPHSFMLCNRSPTGGAMPVTSKQKKETYLSITA